MRLIETVLGEIPPNELGFCQSHEHLCISKGPSYLVNPDLCIDDAQTTLQELRVFRVSGGQAVADAQPVGCGREADTLAFLSEQSGVHIIAATGFHKMMFYPENHWIFEFSEERLSEIFTKELSEGMFLECDSCPPEKTCGYKAGFVKTALESEDFTKQHQKLFEAAAKTASVTGAGIMVHVEKGSNPAMLASFLEERGVVPEQMIFCHLDRMIPDVDVHKALCARGAFVEYDTIARPRYHCDERELEIAALMIDAGYENNILMGLDTTRARLKSYNPDAPGLCYILENFAPLMAAYGIESGIIEKIFIQNPARAFSRS